MVFILAGIVLVIFGSLYLWKPEIYRRGLWMKTSIAISYLSEENYRKYMRGLGTIFVVLGLVCLVVGIVK
jgi:hypothetical protein